MAGLGTGQPLTLKCSQCKRLRDIRSGAALSGQLVRTGRTRANRPRGHVRTGRTAYECECLNCGHVGWYSHKQAEKLPARGGA